MKASEFRAIAKAMREFGLSHVKLGDVELTMFHVEHKGSPEKDAPRVPVNAPNEASNPIEHKVEAMASLLKLSDSELVDELFPDHTQDTDEAA